MSWGKTKEDRFTRIKLQGGLGNQLFGWATAFSLSDALKTNLILDLSLLKPNQYQLGKYKLPEHQINSEKFKTIRVPSHRNRYKIYNEVSYIFDNKLRELDQSAILNGYFQSWKYFESNKQEIKNILTRVKNPSNQYEKLLNELCSEPFISIHVRRGDYLSLTKYHGLTTKEFFESAIKVVKNSTSLDRIVVFSDSPDLSRELLPYIKVHIGPSELISPTETLDLISRGSSLIGSNSSFSWWAAYIRDADDRMCIFPRPWFIESSLDTRDLLPPNWLTLGNE